MIYIVFLNYDPEGKLNEMADKARQSIIDNIPEHFVRFKDYDFIEVKDVKGCVNAQNEGLKLGTSEDFIIFVCNDVEIQDKNWLTKMVQPNCMTGWRFNNFFLTGEPFPDFACWGIDKRIVNKIGLMDKQFENGYGFDDNDYVYRTLEAGFHIYNAQVNLIHHQTKTYMTYWEKEKEEMTARNKAIFLEKWGKKYPLLITKK